MSGSSVPSSMNRCRIRGLWWEEPVSVACNTAADVVQCRLRGGFVDRGDSIMSEEKGGRGLSAVALKCVWAKGFVGQCAVCA